MIKVRCFTNIDKYQSCVWPTEMVCRPEIGDTVEAESGKQLRVVAVTHTTEIGDSRYDSPLDHRRVPVLKVELHLPPGMSLRDIGA